MGGVVGLQLHQVRQETLVIAERVNMRFCEDEVVSHASGLPQTDELVARLAPI